MKNNKFDTYHVEKCCENKLNMDYRSGKELNFKLNHKGNFVRITVPKGRKNIPKGTYSSMARQLQLTVSEFDQLLECPLTKEEYLKKLEQNNQ